MSDVLIALASLALLVAVGVVATLGPGVGGRDYKAPPPPKERD